MFRRKIKRTGKAVIPKIIHQEQSTKKTPLSMESLIQFFDDVEDFFIATALRLRRSLARKPRERRRTLRTKSAASQGQKSHSANSDHLKSQPKADIARNPEIVEKKNGRLLYFDAHNHRPRDVPK